MEEENKKPFDNAQGKETNNEPKIKEVHHHHYQKRGSFFGRLIWGLLIIFIGLVLLGQNAGITPAVNIGAFFSTFWPVFIILLGLSILARSGLVMGIISTVIVLIVFAFLFAWVFGLSVWMPSAGPAAQVQEHKILVERNPLANAAEVRVRFGAGEVNVSGGSSQLAEGTLQSIWMQPKVSNSLDGTIQRASIEPQNSAGGPARWRNVYKNQLDLKLSNTLPLTVLVDSGASSLNLDFSDTVLNSLNLRAGASELNLLIGDKASTSEITINSGASSVTIGLPKDIGARVRMSGGLSSKNFQQLTEVESGVWESANYQAAPKKANISIEAGVSSVNINWR